MSGLMLADGLKKSGWETHVIFSFDGPVVGLYERNGHKTYIAPHKSWLRTKNFLRFIRNVATEIRASSGILTIIRKISADVVYVNTMASFAGAWAAYRNKTRCIWHIRELLDDVHGEMVVPVGLQEIPRMVIR